MGERAVELLRTKPRVFWGRVIRVLVEHGWRPPPLPTSGMERLIDDLDRVSPLASLSLSPTELLVLQGIADGKTYREIAADLGIGRETVKTRAVDAYRNLGATNAANAVAIGFRLGILD